MSFQFETVCATWHRHALKTFEQKRPWRLEGESGAVCPTFLSTRNCHSSNHLLWNLPVPDYASALLPIFARQFFLGEVDQPRTQGLWLCLLFKQVCCSFPWFATWKTAPLLKWHSPETIAYWAPRLAAKGTPPPIEPICRHGRRGKHCVCRGAGYPADHSTRSSVFLSAVFIPIQPDAHESDSLTAACNRERPLKNACVAGCF